ncbi:PhnD/SsuA/transferrin family substrate-binding protein [Rhodoferax saidenbachensis]|uniref:ABC-type phosphate/phosphonate transport system substrate-binding protein n=1 Tax=Rhodoferax saidenbachensis TaxID=1484693 RepID=A0ABU1ZPD3_9BURK|nr:PhnD/SsuA/transferrin family substrate-binding protein [Rhodoferax saidenbachensis]MDR7307414.1 ABC-type phosphate/phosphonate transport system substrate-binding protein [Rhodoferax saidenbachensis]
MAFALPMYFPPGKAVQGFAEALRAELQNRLPPAWAAHVPLALEWPTDYAAHWLSPSLLLSQSCGYPLTHALRGKVQLLGTFVYAVAGAQGIHCRSQIIRRRDDTRDTLAAFRGSTVAYNGRDSQSGYNALRALIAPLAEHGRFFSDALETGAHLQSIRAVLDGRADIAAIDAVTWALALETEPQWAHALTTWTETAPYPGLPLITAAHTPAEVAAHLQNALHTVATAAPYAATRAPLHIAGFVRTTPEDYAVCRAMEKQAAALGVHQL